MEGIGEYSKFDYGSQKNKNNLGLQEKATIRPFLLMFLRERRL